MTDAEHEPSAGGAAASTVVTRASSVRSKRIAWLYRNWIPLGYLTIGTGETKLGKTTWAAHLIAQLTKGLLAGDRYGKPAHALIVAAEDGIADMWKPRLVAAGADLDLVAFLNIPDDWNVRDGIGLIEQAHAEFPAVLAFLDAVMEHLPETHGSETANSPTFVRAALRPAARLASERGISVYISTHPPKGKADSFTGAYAGSGAFVQVSRSCVLFGWHPDDHDLPDDERRRVVLRAAGNVGRDPGALSFRIGGKLVELDDGTSDEIGYIHNVEACAVTKRDLLTADRAAASSDGERKRPKVDVLVDRIRDYLADGEWHPALTREQLKTEGFSGGTVHEAQRRTVYARKTPGTMTGQWQWRLKSSNSGGTSADRGASRARSTSQKPGTSANPPQTPLTTEVPNCQTSSTNGHQADSELPKCQVPDLSRSQTLTNLRQRRATLDPPVLQSPAVLERQHQLDAQIAAALSAAPDRMADAFAGATP